MSQPPIVCLMGPTASGKTQLAVKLVQHFPFEIISVDSAMVYRKMDIGTAKPSADILKIAPHRLINIRDPHDAYSAAQFREDALREIHAIFKMNKIPLLVGGTMLYFRALQQGLAPLPSADATIREELRHEAEKKGLLALHHELSKIDSLAASRIHPHDSQRIQRALEVYRLTEKNLTTWQQEHFTQAPSLRGREALGRGNPETFNSLDCFAPLAITEFKQGLSFLNIAITPHDRSILHERIRLRFQEMLESGLIDEVRKLFERGDLTLDTPAIRSVGYRQVWEYLLGKLTFAEMKEKSIIATRQLAKRQLTWLRSWPHIVWFDSETPDLFEQITHYLKAQYNKDLAF